MLSQISKFCIWKAKQLGEPYYLVKVKNEVTKAIEYDFINYSFECYIYSHIGVCNYKNTFAGEKRGRLPSWREGRWVIVEVTRVN